MTKRPKPTMHGRDHEHGGADPTLIHWEDVGGEGGGTGGLGQGTYVLDSGTSLGGGLNTFHWSLLGGDALLDLADDQHAVPLTAGVYAYNFNFQYNRLTAYLVSVGNYAIFSFDAMGSSEFNAGWQEVRYQAVANDPYFLRASGSVVVHQDPAAGSGAAAWGAVTNLVTGSSYTAGQDKYTGDVLVQKLS